MQRAFQVLFMLGLWACGSGAAQAKPSADGFRLGGKTVDEAFPDPAIAAVAASACSGRAAAVARQVKLGANPNGKGLEDLNPLIWAIGCRNPAGVEALLQAGADPNQRWNGGYTPVYAAAFSPAPEATAMIRSLLKHGGDPNTDDLRSRHTAVWKAMEVGMDSHSWGNWYALIDGGLDINRYDASHDTIAISAASLSQFDRVWELLDRGYSRDLQRLSRLVELPEVDPGNPQHRWQQKVIERLRTMESR